MAEYIKYWVWLSSIPQIGAVKGKKLLEYFGDPRGIWMAEEADLIEIGILTPANIKSLRERKYREEAEIHFENLYRYGIKITTIHDSAYPSYLKNIYDPPIALFSKGKIDDNERMLAVVGSRKATSYGLNMAKVVARELAHCGITVVSGMARGVDSYAHWGALEGKGKTVAVLGCGLDTAYPKENKELMERIAAKGAVLSEYIPGVKPMPHNFPARNRIISGLSLGVVVIEAGEKSGSLITADFALEQGREVFAVPGNLDSANSRGTNRLIKDGAKMVTNIDDILEELNICVNSSAKTEVKTKKLNKELYCGDLDEKEITLVNILNESPEHIDALSEKSGFTVQAVNSLVIMLELKGVIQQMPGKIISLTGEGHV